MRHAAFLALALVVHPAMAEDSRWGTADEPLVQEMLKAEDMWSDGACGAGHGIGAYIADDFQGTSTKGGRYGRKDAIEPDTSGTNRDCKLGEVTFHFFGDSLAVLYGAESRVQKHEDGTEAKRCQVWTDTWLKRNGKWQIVAAQDHVVPCGEG